VDADDIKKEYFVLLNELKQYNPELLDKKIILAITKSDLIDEELKAEMEKDLPDVPYVFISSVVQQGLTELKDLIWQEITDN
jgi:GTP-binding protein